MLSRYTVFVTFNLKSIYFVYFDKFLVYFLWILIKFVIFVKNNRTPIHYFVSIYYMFSLPLVFFEICCVFLKNENVMIL